MEPIGTAQTYERWHEISKLLLQISKVSADLSEMNSSQSFKPVKESISYPVASKHVFEDPVYEDLLNVEDEDDFLKQALQILEEHVKGHHRGERGEGFWKPNKKGKMKHTSAFLSLAHDRLCWLQTGVLGSIATKPHYIEIRHIVSVEQGQYSTNFVLANQLQPMQDETKDRSFSVVTHNRTVDLVARSRIVCKVWVRALTILADQAQKAPVGSILPAYVEEQWHRADTDRTGSIDQQKVLKLVRKLNIEKSPHDTISKFHKVDEDEHGTLDNETFTKFMEELFGERDEIKDLMQKIRSEAPSRRPHMSIGMAWRYVAACDARSVARCSDRARGNGIHAQRRLARSGPRVVSLGVRGPSEGSGRRLAACGSGRAVLARRCRRLLRFTAAAFSPSHNVAFSLSNSPSLLSLLILPPSSLSLFLSLSPHPPHPPPPPSLPLSTLISRTILSASPPLSRCLFVAPSPHPPLSYTHPLSVAFSAPIFSLRSCTAPMSGPSSSLPRNSAHSTTRSAVREGRREEAGGREGRERE